MSLCDVEIILKGGKGSGNFGHSGRPGKRGGAGLGGIRGFKHNSKSDGSNESLKLADSQSDKLSNFVSNRSDVIGGESASYLAAGVAVGDDTTLEEKMKDRKIASDIIIADAIGILWEEESDSSSMLHVQNRASELFGVAPSKWQKNVMNDVGMENMKEDFRAAARETSFVKSVDTFELADSLTNAEIDKSLDNYITNTYERTQKAFADEGITHVKLYRGLAGDFDSLSAGDKTDINGNSIESWTSDKGMADDFASYAREGQTGITIEASVPVSRIFSSSQTGMGLEEEYIVISGKDSGSVNIANKIKGSDEIEERDFLF